MSVSIEIEKETGTAIVSGSGVLGLDDARGAASALWAAPGWNGRSAVWDFRNAEFGLSASDAREVARFILTHQPTPPPSKIAFVTQRDLDYGMARLFGAHRDDSATAFRVFRDYDEAIGWARSLEPRIV